MKTKAILPEVRARYGDHECSEILLACHGVLGHMFKRTVMGRPVLLAALQTVSPTRLKAGQVVEICLRLKHAQTPHIDKARSGRATQIKAGLYKD